MGKKSKPSRRKPQIKIDKGGKNYNPFPAPISQEKFKHPAANPLDSFTGEYNSDEEKQQRTSREEEKDAVNENHVEQFMQSFTAVTDSLSATQEAAVDSSAASEGVGQATGGVWHEVLDANTNCIYYWNQQSNITSWLLPTDATVVKLQSSTDSDQMDATATTTADAAVAAETTEVVTEDLVEYGPQLPDNYIPPSSNSSNEQSSSAAVSDASSRKRVTMDDDGTQDIDNMLDDALEVKRVRLDEGVDSGAGIHGNTILSAEQLSAEISEKLRTLNASKLGVSTLQLVLIQYEMRISDYNNGAISEAYLMDKFQEATKALDEYAVSVAPAGWTCYWNGEAKRYCFHNQSTGDYSWDYPTPQILTHTAVAESVQQPVAMVSESHTPMQSEALQVTEPLQGPLPLESEEVAVPSNVETTHTTVEEEESNNVPNLYSPQALPTNSDITDGSGDVAVHDNTSINTGANHHGNNDGDLHHDNKDDGHHHGNSSDDITNPPIASSNMPSGDITDSDDDIMADGEPPVKEMTNVTSEEQAQVDDSNWVMVERPSVTSDDQSLESMDSLTEECVETIGSGDPASISLGAQTEVITDNSELPVGSVEQPVVATTTAAVVTSSVSSSLPLDTGNQDAGGSVADDEAEEDEMDDWWRSKGPGATKPPTTTSSSSSTQQPKWSSLKFTKQLKTRWGMGSSSVVTTTTAKDAQVTMVTPTKASDVLAWFPEEEEKKELALPTAEEIAETKEREEQLAAARKEREREKLAKMEETAVSKGNDTTTVSDRESQDTSQQDQIEQPTPTNDDKAATVTMETATTAVATEVTVTEAQQPKAAKEGEDDGSSSDSSDSSSSSSSSSFTLSSDDSSSSEEEEEEEIKATGKQKEEKDMTSKEQPITESTSTDSRTDHVKVSLEVTEGSHQQQEEQPISAEIQQPLPSSEEAVVSAPEETADDGKTPMVTGEQTEAMEIEASPEHNDDMKMEEEITEAPTQQDVSETPKEVEKAKVEQILPSAEQPHLSAEQPHPSAEQPHPSAEQPHPSAEQLHPSAEQPHPSAEQPHPSAEQLHPLAEKQEVKESTAMPNISKSSQSAKLIATAREESPPPPPPPSTTGAVAMATNSPHYASTSTSYTQSPNATPGSEGYSAYLQAYAYYAAHAQAQAAQYYANYPQAAAYARMYQAYGNPYGNTSSYGNQYDSTSYYNYAARAYAAQAQNYSNSSGGHQSEEDSSARSDKLKRK